MTELLTAAQMRAIEHAAIESGAVTGLELMERAGQGVVDAIFAHWPELAPSRGPAPAPPGYLRPEEGAALRAVVLCGPGNNGGDGFVVARLLREQGWDVQVFLEGEAETLPPDARANAARWMLMGNVGTFDDMLARHADAETSMRWFVDDVGQGTIDLLVDALFGTGLTRPLAPHLVEFFAHARGGFGAYRSVALDLPSGICSDSGRFLVPDRDSAGIAEFAEACDLTLAFHALKRGHVLGQGPGHSLAVRVVDIGLRTPGYMEGTVDLARPGRLAKHAGHKFDHGSALVLCGGVGKGGAGRLAARGALRIGAGLVTVGAPPAALIENAAQLDAIMLRAVKDAAALSQALEDDRINAVCLGPGLGHGAREAGLLAAALDGLERHPARALVLDGDALTLLSWDEALMRRLDDRCVLTPHGGEFARLFPDIAERLDAPATTGPAYSRVDAAREAAARCGAVVVLKGPDTVIAAPDGACAVNAAIHERAAPWLATAGAGDVLAGFVTGLLARGLRPFAAAQSAAWMHVECARAFGPGLIAEDLPEALPGVLRALGE